MIHRLAALLTASAVLLAAAAATSAGTVPADPAPLLLRLPDLGPGYVILKRARSCLALRPSMPKLRRTIGLGPYDGCLLTFQRFWNPPGGSPGPAAVHTLALAFGTPAEATAVLSRPRRAAALLFRHRDLRIVGPAPGIGDQAALMRVDKKTILGLHLSAGVVLWRSGSVLGMVVAGSLARGDANVQAAVRLAALQQARIAIPTPLRPPVNDDLLVPLDNPTLGVPVMWLGEHLPAHDRLPALKLSATGPKFDWFAPPQLLVRQIYSAPRLPHAVRIELWRPRTVRRFLRRPIPTHLCQRRFDVDVPGARAWILASRQREPRRASGLCRHSSASLAAVAFFDDVAVSIELGGRSHPNPYNSRAGLRTLLLSLRPRPLPTS